MALGVLTNTGISLGNLDIALDYLSDPSEFETELAEVKTTIYNKEEKQHTTSKKDIVKPKLTEQALMNMFSIVPSKKDIEADESLDTDITMKDSSDFDVDFDDMDFDFEDDEDTEEVKPINSVKQITEETVKIEEKQVSDITQHIDLNILKLVQHSDELEDSDEEDDSSEEDEDLFIDDEDSESAEQDLFADDEEDDIFMDDDEDEEQDLFEDDIDSLFEDDEDEVIESPKPVQQQIVEQQIEKPVQQTAVKIVEQQEEDDLFMDDDEDDLLADDEDDLFADDEDDMEDMFDLEDDDEPIQKTQVVKKVEQSKPVEKQVEQSKPVEVKNNEKKEVSTQQSVKSAAEIELELLRKQLAEKDRQINKLINNDKKSVQATQEAVKVVNRVVKTIVKAEDNIDKLTSKAVVKDKPKEVEGSPYDKYTVMQIDALYKVVKDFMIKNGVRKGPLDIKLLNDKFGVDNVKKLTTKHYLIKTKKGVTVGI